MTSRPLQPPRPQLQPPSLAHPSSSSHSSSSTTTTQTPTFTHTHQPYHHHNPHLSAPVAQPNNSTSSGFAQIKTEPSSSPSSFPPSQSASPTMDDQLMTGPSPGSSSSGGELGDDYDDEDQVVDLSNSGFNGMNGMNSATSWEGHVNEPIQSQPIQLQHPHQSGQRFTHGQGHVNPSSLGMGGIGPRNGSGSGSGPGSGFAGNRGINVADLHSAGGGGYSAAGSSSRNGQGYGQASAMAMAMGGMGNNHDGSLGVDEDLEAILPPPSASSMGSGPGSAGLGGRFEPWSHGQGRIQQPLQHQGNQFSYQHQQQNSNHQQSQHQQSRGMGQSQQASNQAGRVQQQNHNGVDTGRLEGHEMLHRREEMDGFHAASNMEYPPPLEQQQQQQPQQPQQLAAPTPGPPGLSSEKARTLELLLVKFWTNQMDLAERGLPPQPISSSSSGGGAPPVIQKEEFKNFALPLARIKKVMKSDPEVKMISAEVPVLLGKCCEIFIAELTSRAWLVAQSNKRRTLQKSDVAAAIGYSDMFDFLIDIVPREEVIPAGVAGVKNGEPAAGAKRKKDDEVDDGGGKRQRGDDDEDN